MRIRLPILLVAHSLCFLEIFAQIKTESGTRISSQNKSDYYSNFTPQTPGSSALGNFGNVPINYFTRLPEVSINLMTLTSRELSIPISVNYDATGVRLDEFSGPVGLKWNLDAGGHVTRQLNGHPDEHPSKGYWLYQSELNGSTINVDTWVSAAQQNSRDTEPDEFVINIPGRSIRFYMKARYTIVPVPHQNVMITSLIENGKIKTFQLVTEDGTRYEFGGITSAIEERKSDNLSVHCSFKYPIKTDEYYYTNTLFGGSGYRVAEGFFYQNPGSELSEIHDYNMVETLGSFYNSKWYLTKITSPSGDEISFNYVREQVDVKYVTQPAVTLKEPLINYLDFGFTYTKRVPVKKQALGDKEEDRTFTHDTWYTPAYAKFNNTCLDEANCNSSSGSVVNQIYTDIYVSPVSDKSLFEAYPQMVSVNQSLVTEAVVRLTTIVAKTGSKVEFGFSPREDLPNSFKYDKLDLYSLNNTLIKTIKLKYSTVSALTGNDYMWLTEGVMMTFIDLTGSPAKTYYAYQCNFAESAITRGSSAFNYVMKKYPLEGLKAYNYKRVFLESITEYSNGVESLINAFEYQDRSQLRRRLSPVQSALGQPTAWEPNNRTKDLVLYPSTNKAKIMSPFNPSDGRDSYFGRGNLGILNKIIYPTGGYTRFTFGTDPSLTRIEDFASANQQSPASVKDIRGLSAFFPMPGILKSYESEVVGKSGTTTYYKRFKVESSYLQNRFASQTHGVRTVFRTVRVYNGKSSDHKGYEDFLFNTQADGYTKTYSSPALVDGQGNAIDVNQPNAPLMNIFPFAKKKENLLRGTLEEHIVYDKNDRKLLWEKSTYTVNPNGYQPTKIVAFAGGYQSATKRWARPEIVADWIVVSRKTEKLYDQLYPDDETKTAVTVTDLTYKSGTLALAESATYNESQPSYKTITKLKYSADFSFAPNCDPITDPNCGNMTPPIYTDALQLMSSLHQLNAPVEKQNLVEDNGTLKLVSAVAYKYRIFNSGPFVKPVEVWGTESPLETTGQSKYVDAFIDPVSGHFLLDGRMRLLHSFDTYNAAGNLLQQTSKDGTISTYNWDGTNSLVIASTITPGSQQQVTSYNHKPGVGLRSTTDANGRTTSFEYDFRNRLKLTRDHDLNIVNRYRYHYASETENQATFSHSLNENNTFQFSITNSTIPGSQYTWDCGNGTVTESTGSSIGCSYSTPGTYTVKLVVTNPEYSTTISSKTVTVLPALSIATSGTNSSINICGGAGAKSVTLNASVTGGPYTYQWLYRRSGYETTWHTVGSNSASLVFNTVGVNGSTNEVVCRITDVAGNIRYSNFAYVSYYCYNSDGSSNGPGTCPPGTTWDPALGKCIGTCPPDCVWNTSTNSCNCN